MKRSSILGLIFLTVLFLLLLLPLWVFLQGAIAGSFEAFLRAEELPARRAIYIVVTGAIALTECLIGHRAFQMIRELRNK